jgi:diadenosine tetraphosphate (Ap4A) HIT family hydrolase
MNFSMPVMDPCHFCDLAQRRVDSWNVVVEDPLTMTALNGRQYECGQSIVFTKRHAPALLLYQNNGILSGQEVPHFHLHVVPRSAGSDWGTGPAHLARVHDAQRAAHLDHAVITEEKITSARRLADSLRGA